MDMINPSLVPDGRRVALHGRFDAHEAPALTDWVTQQVAAGTADLEVDLSDVRFLDSVALAALVRALKACRAAGGELVLASPSQPVRVILELTRLDAAFIVSHQAPLGGPSGG